MRFALLFVVSLSFAHGAHAEDLFKRCTTAAEPDEKISLCTQLIESGDRAAIGHMNRGIAYLDKEDYENAIADLDKALELDPKLAFAYHKRGMAHVAGGKDDLALSDFTKAVEADADAYDSYKARGDVHYRAGDREAALADYSEAIDRAQGLGIPDPDLHCTRAAVYVEAGNNAKAGADYDAADAAANQEGYCN